MLIPSRFAQPPDEGVRGYIFHSGLFRATCVTVRRWAQYLRRSAAHIPSAASKWI